MGEKKFSYIQFAAGQSLSGNTDLNLTEGISFVSHACINPVGRAHQVIWSLTAGNSTERDVELFLDAQNNLQLRAGNVSSVLSRKALAPYVGKWVMLAAYAKAEGSEIQLEVAIENETSARSAGHYNGPRSFTKHELGGGDGEFCTAEIVVAKDVSADDGANMLGYFRAKRPAD